MTEAPELDAALAVMQAHLDALNARDEEAIALTLHFPHYRLSGGKMRIWDRPGVYFEDFRKRAGEEWGYTKWGELSPLQISSEKVHLSVQVDRYRADGLPLTSFKSLWVIARIDDVWAAQLRSSFASDL
ncbi:hypothetical protein ACOTTU_01660 [Roseobacter sp. EG26]|uniref:hypothetical protein n=1 Tax=Roseobacter sp. EG26 TaxID=3412477 RepID=UPI002636053A|nr:hypothetical protein [uncultured Roseobacter sp.]